MLKDKTIFISGGTGYLGEGICRVCAKYGAKIYFSYHQNESKAREIEKTIPGSCGIPIDLSSVKDIETKIQALLKKDTSICYLVNNAAISRVLPLAMLEEKDVDEVLNVNIKGLIFLTKSFVRPMIRQKRGHILTIGSIAGQRILDVPLTYAMTKAAVSGMTFALAAELKSFNIRVNSIIPGMMAGGVASAVPEDLRHDFIRHCTTGRMGTAEDLGEFVAFLLSEKSSYINGQNIPLDGGIY